MLSVYRIVLGRLAGEKTKSTVEALAQGEVKLQLGFGSCFGCFCASSCLAFSWGLQGHPQWMALVGLF